MKDITRKLLSTALAVVSAFSLMACGGGKDSSIVDTPVQDGKTVNVRIYSAGYGTSYIYAMADQFNETYKAEGYKINVLAPQEDLSNTNMLQDIYQDNGTDLYFCTCSPSLGVNGPYGTMLEDITQTVYNQKPIRFDGTEEDITIKEKLGDFKSDDALDGKYYGLPYVDGFGGLAVNTKVLAEYGLEIPRTTNELMHCADVIMGSAAKTRVFPFTYSVSDNIYPLMYAKAWLMQYEGEDGYNQFWSMLNADGSRMEKPYEVFGTDGITEMLKVMYRVFDYNIGADGSAMQDYNEAQAQLMRGDAAFYAVGDWMFNEEYHRFPKNTSDVTIVNIPVISSLGTKVFGDEFNAETCEQILTTICKYVDQNLELAQIEEKTEQELGVALDTADVQTICETRGMVVNASGSSIWLSINSKVKDIAALFMRMCASDDGGALIASNTKTNNPFALNALKNSEYPWLRASSSVLSNRFFNQVRGKTVSDYRSVLSVSAFIPLTGDNIHSYLLDQTLTVYSGTKLEKTGNESIFDAAAEKLAADILAHAKKQYDEGIWNTHK